MAIDRLYIIGNGFDIHHNIKSSYYNYRDWLGDNYPYIFDQIEETFGVYEVIEGPNGVEIKDEWWGNFEENLGEIDLAEMVDNWVEENYPNFASDDFHDREYHEAEIEAEVELSTLINQIKGTFSEWVSSLDNPSLSEKIEIHIPTSLFLTFNYTHTLESLYNVPQDQICYIHGRADTDEDLILGHGKNEADLKEMVDNTPEPPTDLEPEEMQDWYEGHYDVIKEWTRESAVREYLKIYKDCQEIIREHGYFFYQCDIVSEIFIFGLSFSSVDLPYLQEVYYKTKKSDPVWTVSFYREEEEDKFKEILMNIGVPGDRIKMIRLYDVTLRNLSQPSLFTDIK